MGKKNKAMKESVEQTSEAVAEQATGGAEAVAEKVEAVAETTAEKVEAEAAEAGAAGTDAVGQVTSFVKEQLEQAQRHLETLVSRGRESGLEVLLRLNANVEGLRENPKVRELEKKATWVGGEVRQRLDVLQRRMVTVVGGVASQSQVEAINRELDRLTRKLDSLVSSTRQAPKQETPEA